MQLGSLLHRKSWFSGKRGRQGRRAKSCDRTSRAVFLFMNLPCVCVVYECHLMSMCAFLACMLWVGSGVCVCVRVWGGAFACMSTAGRRGGSTAGRQCAQQCAQLTASTTGTGWWLWLSGRRCAASHWAQCGRRQWCNGHLLHCFHGDRQLLRQERRGL